MQNSIAADGLFVREMRPSQTPKGAFVLLHGMESHSGWFVDLATRLVARNYAVVSYDRPGWGKSPGTRGHLESYQHFVENTGKIASQVRAKYGPTHLAGMSWGGMASLYLGLRRGWLFDSITLMSPGLVSQRDLPFADKARLALDFLRRSGAGMLTPAFDPHHFTTEPEWQNFIANDPDRVRQVTSAFCIETLKMRTFIKQTAGRRQLPPTLCLLAGKDEIIDNDATAEICRRAGAGVEILSHAAHTLIFEKPEQTADTLARHADNASEAARTKTGKVWVLGAGAVGGSIASLLSFANVETGVLVKPSHLASMRAAGFTLQSGNAVRGTRSSLVFADAADGLPPQPDLVIFAVKSFDTPQLIHGLEGRIPAGSILASLQNGIENEEKISQAFPEHTVVAASICASLELTAPGHALWADDRGGLGAALHHGNADIARNTWQNIMSRTGMECRWVKGPLASQRLKWSKLMLNTAFNALNSVTGLSSAAILADENYGPLALQALAEGFAAMDRQHLDPVDLPGFPVSKMRLLLKMPSSVARRVMSWQAARAPEAAFSMRQDFLKKRQHTEITDLNGKIAEVGRHLGLPTPANEKLVEMVNNLR